MKQGTDLEVSCFMQKKVLRSPLNLKAKYKYSAHPLFVHLFHYIPLLMNHQSTYADAHLDARISTGYNRKIDLMAIEDGSLGLGQNQYIQLGDPKIFSQQFITCPTNNLVTFKFCTFHVFYILFLMEMDLKVKKQNRWGGKELKEPKQNEKNPQERKKNLCKMSRIPTQAG